MKLSEITVLPEYFDRYMNMNDDIEILDAIQTSIAELQNVPLKKWKAIGDKVYAPGKWTIKDILQHLIDTERVFSYRATSFARSCPEVLPFDDTVFANNTNANKRSLDDLLEEAICLRKSFLWLYRSFDDVMLRRIGIGLKGPYSVADIGFTVPGHQRWHFNVIEEKYSTL